MAALAGCGASSGPHYAARDAIECLRQGASLTLAARDDGVLLAFSSDDGVSALEFVSAGLGGGHGAAVAAAQRSESNRVGAALGLGAPTWEGRKGDAAVRGVGPYVPAIARRQGISSSDASRAARVLGSKARRQVAACLAGARR